MYKSASILDHPVVPLYSHQSHCLGSCEVESIISVCGIRKAHHRSTCTCKDTHARASGNRLKCALKQVSLLCMFCELPITLYYLHPNPIAAKKRDWEKAPHGLSPWGWMADSGLRASTPHSRGFSLGTHRALPGTIKADGF